MRKLKSFKKIVLLFFVCLFTFSLAGCSMEELFSDDDKIMYPTVMEDTFVYDQGDFLSSDVETQVNEMLCELEKQTTIEFAVITIPNLNGMDIEDYSYDLANELEIGKEDKDNGILLLISRTDTKVRLEIGEGLEGILTDRASGDLLDNFFVPYRDNDEYDEAVSKTVQGIINYLASSGEYQISITSVNSDYAIEYQVPLTLWQWALIIIGILILLVLLEIITGYIFGDGPGDGIVVMFLEATGDSSKSSSKSSSGGSSRGSFGGGSFGGGGASR